MLISQKLSLILFALMVSACGSVDMDFSARTVSSWNLDADYVDARSSGTLQMNEGSYQMGHLFATDLVGRDSRSDKPFEAINKDSSVTIKLSDLLALAGDPVLEMNVAAVRERILQLPNLLKLQGDEVKVGESFSIPFTYTFKKRINGEISDIVSATASGQLTMKVIRFSNKLNIRPKTTEPSQPDQPFMVLQYDETFMDSSAEVVAIKGTVDLAIHLTEKTAKQIRLR